MEYVTAFFIIGVVIYTNSLFIFMLFGDTKRLKKSQESNDCYSTKLAVEYMKKDIQELRAEINELKYRK